MLNSTEHEIEPTHNVEMSTILTIVCILTFISKIITSYESLKARIAYLLKHFNFYGQLKFYAQFSENKKSFITSGPSLSSPPR